MLSDFKNSHPRTWPNSSHLVHFSSHKIYTTPQFSVYIDAKDRQSGACSQRRDKGPADEKRRTSIFIVSRYVKSIKKQSLWDS